MEELSATEGLALGLSRAYYALARTLRLNKLRDLIAAASLSVEAPVCLLGRSYSCSRYGSEEEALSHLLDHFQSILWMSYRRGFTPIPAGGAGLGSDAGWGCTLRSGQMILAQGLQRHLLGADWRWPDAAPAGSGSGAAPPPELARLLQLFWDTPAERNAFSLHNLCAHGRRCGVAPGRWLGPWVMCKALEATACVALQHHDDLGLTVAVLADAGGGAPLLVPARFEGAFAGGCGGSVQQAKAREEQQEQLQQQQDAEQQEGDRGQHGRLGGAAAGLGHGLLAAEESAPELISLDSCTLAVEAPLPAAALAASVGGGGGGSGGERGGGTPCRRGLILLVPLVLGLGKLNPRYVPQLEAVLAWPQSIGVVGGRPSSSLYFVGWQAAPTHTQQHQSRQQQHRQQQPHAPPAEHHGPQLKNNAVAVSAAPMACEPVPAAPAAATPGAEQQPRQQPKQQQASQPKQQGAQGRESTAAVGGVAGSSVIYLDPHQVQEAACSDDDWQTFHCEVPRSMALASIDPSLALGFYCGSLEEYRDLCARLAGLEARSGGAPLVCVASAEAAAAAAAGYESPDAPAWVSDELSSEEETEGEGDEEDAVAVELENGDEAAAFAPDAASGGQPSGSSSNPCSPRSSFVQYQAAAPPPPPLPHLGSPNGARISPRRASRSGSGWEVL